MAGLGFYTPGLPAAGDEPNTLPLTGNERIPADTGLPEGLEPQSEAITTSQLFGFVSGNATNVRIFGAKGDGVTNDSSAVNDAIAEYNLSAVALGATTPPSVAQGSGVYFPSGQYLCPQASLTGTGTGWAVFGDGTASAILQGTITVKARLGSVRNLSMWGNGVGTAITIGDSTFIKYERVVENVQVEGYDIGVSAGKAAFDVITTSQFNACNTGIVVGLSAGVSFTDVEVNIANKDGMIVQGGLGSGEIKAENLRILASGWSNYDGGGGSGSAVGFVNLRITGDTRAPVNECYWTNLTATENAQRHIPITSAADNGSGGTRFYTSVTYTYTTISGVSAFVPSKIKPGQYECWSTVSDGGVGSSMTSLLAGTTQLLSAPVASTGSVITTCLAIVAAVNAGTARHGYTAETIGASVWIYAPVGAQVFFQALVATISGGTLTFTPDQYTWIDLGQSQDFLVGEDICLTGYYSGAFGAGGFATVYYAPKDSDPVVIVGHVNSHILAIRVGYQAATGSAWRPNRLSNGLSVGKIYVSTVPSGTAVAITAVDHNYFEVATIPFTSTTTGYLSMPGWDVLMETNDFASRVNDMFFTGGNINFLLIKSAFNAQFVGTRVKTQFWIDPRLNQHERSNRITLIANAHSRGHGNPWDSTLPDGALTGWNAIADQDPNVAPGSGRFCIISPNSASLTRGVYNEIGTNDAGLVLRIAGVSMDITSPYLFPMTALHNAKQSGLTDTHGISLISTAGFGGRVSSRTTTGIAGERVDLSLYALGVHSSINFYTTDTKILAVQMFSAVGANNWLTLSGSSSGVGGILGTAGADGFNKIIRSLSPIQYPSFVKAQLPSASVAGQLVFCSDATGGASLCQSVGGGWLSLRTNAAP